MLFCSHGANNARGVAILIRNNFDCAVEESGIVDSNGRFIILKVLLSREPALQLIFKLEIGITNWLPLIGHFSKPL